MNSNFKAENTKDSRHNNSFNFDLWASQVRPQLLAALQKSRI